MMIDTDTMEVKMRSIYKYLLVIFVIILQGTLFRYIAILGVKPDALLILVIAFSLLNGTRESIILSLFGGILVDVLFNNAIGFVTISLLSVAYLTGLLSKNVFKESTFVAFVFVFLGTILYNLIMVFSMLLMKYDINPSYLFNVIIVQSVYNSFITIFAYRYIVMFNSYINTKKFFFKI
ncbi:MAG: rod shape-determining protein MreD [Thermoanaerobacterium sp.]|nr:rod shape-determining protein MreD [Thermoanaerobacterium sp.]